MYEVIVILKALTEVAGVAFLGQGVLWVIAGAKREQNFVYKLFVTLTSPVFRITRIITPRLVLDRHLWLVVLFLLVVLWVALTVFKIKLVLDAAAAAS
jgi:hypothetical protein